MRTVRTTIEWDDGAPRGARPGADLDDLRHRVERWCVAAQDDAGAGAGAGADAGDGAGAPSAGVEAGAALLRELAGAAGHHAAVTLEVDPSTGTVGRAAALAGFVLVRDLVEMRRDLPLPDDTSRRALALRSFRPGVDEPDVVAVNNRAFDWHPEQAGWTVDHLREREREPWFDPAGFLLHHHDGQLAGFCWTKVHHEERPPGGEIFVIGVDPVHHGRGLGRDLVVAGLDHLAGRGLRRALLWTEADNAPAVGLYRSLGFVPTRHHRWYRHGAPADPGAQRPEVGGPGDGGSL